MLIDLGHLGTDRKILISQGFFCNFGMGPYRAFQIGKISMVNCEIEKSVIVHNSVIFWVNKKTN